MIYNLFSKRFEELFQEKCKAESKVINYVTEVSAYNCLKCTNYLFCNSSVNHWRIILNCCIKISRNWEKYCMNLKHRMCALKRILLRRGSIMRIKFASLPTKSLVWVINFRRDKLTTHNLLMHDNNSVIEKFTGGVFSLIFLPPPHWMWIFFYL